MRVVLDTNALLMPFEFRINIDTELRRLLGNPEIYIPSCVIGELNRLSKKRWEGKAALQLARKYNIIEVSMLGDSGVIEAGKKLGAYVVTNDRNLIEKLKKEGIKIVTLSNHHLVIENE